jgi:DNA sulfur modification protein DndE
MLPSKISITQEAGGVLRALAQRARLTPNLLARMALTTSLELGPIGPTAKRADIGTQEFNTYTLLGGDQDLYLALVEIVENEAADRPDDRALVEWTVAHIERGISQIALRIKSPSDAARLMVDARA